LARRIGVEWLGEGAGVVDLPCCCDIMWEVAWSLFVLAALLLLHFAAAGVMERDLLLLVLGRNIPVPIGIGCTVGIPRRLGCHSSS
jgi:hypothetical protein